MKGFRQNSKSDRLDALEKSIKNLEVTGRIAQMLIQQVGNAVSPMTRDFGELAQRQRDAQYRMLAIQSLLGLDVNAIDQKAEELNIKDFNDTSDKEDLEKGYTLSDVVAEDSIVIITSKTPEEKEDKGILRSKLIVKNIGFPDLREQLLSKKTGDVVTTDVNGVKHEITVLGIRSVPVATETAQPLTLATPESVTVNGTEQQ